MPVVLPEKTLEHWASIYLANRYASRGVQYWPVNGPDVFVALNGIGFGKLIWLEVKTATWRGTPVAGRQHVEIDLYQLAIHAGRTIPTYYVLPAPFWTGTLGDEAATIRGTGTSVLDLGFRRSGAYWFGNWTWVISAVDLYGALMTRYLATLAFGHLRPRGYLLPSPPGAWAISGTPGAVPRLLPWADFWDAMDLCGAEGLNSVLVSHEAAEEFVLNGVELTALVRQLGQANPPFSPTMHSLSRHDDTWTLTHVPGTVADVARQDAHDLSARGSSSLVLIPADALRPDPPPTIDTPEGR